jgi:hypothetical protein
MPEGLSADATKSRPEASGGGVTAPQGPGNRVAELQVSAHLMTLESGLFCVFPAPGSPMPDPVTSLPGVRITPAPGLAGRPEAVSVSTFREDGWLNGTAALVRVTDGTAQILVTIYQDKGQDAAPRLQVLRLSGDPAAPGVATPIPAAAAPGAPAPVAPAVPVQAQKPVGAKTPAASEPGAEPQATPEMMAHVQRMGDVTCDLGDWLGVKGSRQWVEGFGLAPRDGIALTDIEYQAVLGRNWLSPWVDGGKYCGSRGMALPLLGIKVRLKNEAAKRFDVTYSATFIDGSSAGPASNGEPCESESLAALEAFQISVKPRAAAASKPAARKTAPRPVAKPPGNAKPAGRARSK